jgi:NadR type nicotinamide-nucleotide adenylyltransferase
MNVDHSLQVTKLKRIAIVGPECTGKTSLATQLASICKTTWVPEFARTFLEKLGRPYIASDLIDIAKGQLDLEDSLAPTANKLLICDTNLLVIKIWSEFKYNSCHPWILENVLSRHYDLYFLTDIDMPWEEDPQRENPEQREELFGLYKKALDDMMVKYILLSGNEEKRIEKALAAIKELQND